MKIAQLQTTNGGGAGIAALRLHTALHNRGVESSIFFSHYHGTLVPHVHVLSGKTVQTQKRYFADVFNAVIHPGNTMFGSNYPSLAFDELGFLQQYDVINLHWVQHMLSAEAIAFLSHTNTPIVWTAHDRNPLTGGCHCFHGCDAWLRDCKNCPQLINTFDDFPSKVFEYKKRHWNTGNMTIVALNKGLARLYKKSPVFLNARVEVLHNSIDLAGYYPADAQQKARVRKRLKLPQNKTIMLYAADYNSTIKGYKECVSMLRRLTDKTRFYIVVLGNVTDDVKTTGVAYTHCGKVPSSHMPRYYHAADMTVISSSEESLPNIMVESLSCGVPVIGFSIDALVDFVVPNRTGYTAEAGDVAGLARCVETLADASPARRVEMSEACRLTAEKYFAPHVQACGYHNLYKNLIKNKKTSRATQKTKVLVPRAEVNPTTAPVVINVLTHALHKVVNDPWYQFGRYSTKRKCLALGARIARKLRVYAILAPPVTLLLKCVQKIRHAIKL